MKRKVVSLMLTATMAVGMLAACGSNDNASSAGNSSSAASTSDASVAESTGDASAAEDSSASTEEEAITTTLTVWAPSEDQSADSGQWLQTMCEQFNAAHPNWDLTFEYGVCAEGDAKSTVTQDVEGAADVYMFANDNLTALISANGIAKLGGQTAEAVKNTNSQAIVDSVSVDGSIYGVPFTTNTWFMFYDKSVFSEDDIKNLDTMLSKGKVSFPITNSWYIASFYVANGCTLFGEDGTDEAAGIDFSGEKAQQVTDYLVDLVANPNFVSDADGSGLSGLRDGSVSAMFSGSWDASSVAEALGENYGVAQLPCITINGEEKQLKSFAGSKAIGVNPNCEYPQVAVALASYLGSAEAQKAHYELRSVIPCNTELLADPDIASDVLVTAQNNTFDNTSIIQPFVKAMDNYWTPAENFGKSLVSKEVTHENAVEKTEQLNTSLNSSVVE
ncbi:MAG: extracellular solute-binding protein [Fusicatenibacter sp.]|nr:extracellular solute-binding protein [Fusicatenibacter sp.]